MKVLLSPNQPTNRWMVVPAEKWQCWVDLVVLNKISMHTHHLHLV